MFVTILFPDISQNVLLFNLFVFKVEHDDTKTLYDGVLDGYLTLINQHFWHTTFWVAFPLELDALKRKFEKIICCL